MTISIFYLWHVDAFVTCHSKCGHGYDLAVIDLRQFHVTTVLRNFFVSILSANSCRRNVTFALWESSICKQIRYVRRHRRVWRWNNSAETPWISNYTYSTSNCSFICQTHSEWRLSNALLTILWIPWELREIIWLDFVVKMAIAKRSRRKRKTKYFLSKRKITRSFSHQTEINEFVSYTFFPPLASLSLFLLR